MKYLIIVLLLFVVCILQPACTQDDPFEDWGGTEITVDGKHFTAIEGSFHYWDKDYEYRHPMISPEVIGRWVYGDSLTLHIKTTKILYLYKTIDTTCFIKEKCDE